VLLAVLLPLPGFSLFIQVARIVFIFMARDVNAISHHTKKVLANGYSDKRKLMGLTLVKEALQVFLHIIDFQERVDLN